MNHVVLGALLLLMQAPVSPGVNFFSLKQDIAIGSASSSEAEKTLPLVRDANLNQYFRSLGLRLSRHSELPALRYKFRIVNTKEINSLGFPGGSIYVNRGLIELTSKESELAAVLAHEIGHVAARHGTVQLSRQLLVQAPLSIATGLPTEEGWKDQLMKLGVSFGAKASFLRYNRDQEMEANLTAVRLLSEARFDPHALWAIIQKVSQKAGEDVRLPAFVFNHPTPESLSRELENEVERLTTARVPAAASADFRAFHAALHKMSWPAAKETAEEAASETLPGVFTHPADYYRLSYPAGWQVRSTGPDGAIIAPADGVQSSRIGEDVTRGVMFDMFDISERPMTLDQATNRLIVFLRQRNQSLRAVPGAQTHILIGDEPGLRTVMIGKSSATDSQEVVWLVTRIYYQSLFYMVFVAPEEEFPAHQPVFEQILRSVRLR